MSATWAPPGLDHLLYLLNHLPLGIESAPFLGLPAKLRPDSLYGERRPEQHPYEQAAQQDQAHGLDGHRALRCIPPRRCVS
jgi:hypothetical protein